MKSCKRCKSYGRPGVPADLTSYWGDPLCRPCAVHVAQLLDERDNWPPVPWSAEDKRVMADG